MTSAPALAQTVPTDPPASTTTEVSTTTTEVSTTTTEVSTTTTSTTTTSTTTTAPPPRITSSAQVGPATAIQQPAMAGQPLPARGNQIQITKPPPPPPTLPPWDPFRLPANSGSGRRVVYSKTQQTVWALDDNNTVIKVHRVSGKQTPFDPAPGVYRVYSRSRYTYSINNPSITWGYMIRFAKGARGGNIGLHEIPMQNGRPMQSVAQLGQPLSGGCVRQAVPDAVWMWNWAGIGTVVVVTP
jgi:lipoprotein-anchoring transpeptidase ErfK/SrfK